MADPAAASAGADPAAADPGVGAGSNSASTTDTFGFAARAALDAIASSPT